MEKRFERVSPLTCKTIFSFSIIQKLRSKNVLYKSFTIKLFLFIHANFLKIIIRKIKNNFFVDITQQT